MIERMAKEQGISFADAAEQFYTMRQPDRTNIAALTKVYEDAKLYNPAYKDLTFQQWLQANGIGQPQGQLSAAGQDAFSRNRTQISG